MGFLFNIHSIKIMKLIYLFIVSFTLLLGCKNTENSQEKIIKSNLVGEATIEKNESGDYCVTCANGYKKCCTSPKSPVVNCIKRSGSCQ